MNKLKYFANTFILIFVACSAHASDLGNLNGIKWKQALPERGGEHHDMVHGRLARPKDKNGHYLSFETIAKQLKLHGVDAVSFRIDSQNRYIDENKNGTDDEFNAYHNELKLATKALKDNNIKVYLFSRIWLSRRSPNYVIRKFDTYLGQLSESERSLIDGIALTEVHIDDMATLKKDTLKIAKGFEKKYSGWLKNRALIMPGLDNGFRFTDVNTQDDFHHKMKDYVGEFAFSVKSMKLKKVDDPKRIYRKFKNYLEKSRESIEAREKYIGEYLAIDDLVEYQKKAKVNFPNLANIVFWGDSGDSLILIHPKGAKALQNVIVKHDGYDFKTSFMYAGVGGMSMVEDDQDIENIKRTFGKSIIKYSESEDEFKKHDIKIVEWEDSIGTYDQWRKWSQDYDI